MYGWTMLYKWWGHPVATLPVTNGTIRDTRTMMEILRNKQAMCMFTPERLISAVLQTCDVPKERKLHLCASWRRQCVGHMGIALIEMCCEAANNRHKMSSTFARPQSQQSSSL
eukprot:6208223-Pleurochrysis_carterae.AAC.4